MRSLCISLLKYLLFVFNILVFVFNIPIITLGIYVVIATASSTASAKVEEYLLFISEIGITFIIGGSIICVSSCFACWGAVSKNPHILIASAILESIIVLFNIALSIRIEVVGYVLLFGKHTMAIILGASAAVEIVGIVLASFMASFILAERHRDQIQELL